MIRDRPLKLDNAGVKLLEAVICVAGEAGVGGGVGVGGPGQEGREVGRVVYRGEDGRRQAPCRLGGGGRGVRGWRRHSGQAGSGGEQGRVEDEGRGGGGDGGGRGGDPTRGA